MSCELGNFAVIRVSARHRDGRINSQYRQVAGYASLTRPTACCLVQSGRRSSARSGRRRHLFKAWALAAGMHPGLGAGAVDFHGGGERGRIVERAGQQERHPRQSIGLGDNAGAAIRAELTADLPSRIAGIVVGLQLAPDVDRVRRKRDDGFERGAGIALAIAAMAQTAEGGLAAQRIADPSAKAATAQVGHGITPLHRRRRERGRRFLQAQSRRGPGHCQRNLRTRRAAQVIPLAASEIFAPAAKGGNYLPIF